MSQFDIHICSYYSSEVDVCIYKIQQHDTHGSMTIDIQHISRIQHPKIDWKLLLYHSEVILKVVKCVRPLVRL